VQAEFLTITLSVIIIQLANRQLDKYNYTTPPAGHVCFVFLQSAS
jgi:hypothetical protein